jgi:outer membrane protein
MRKYLVAIVASLAAAGVSAQTQTTTPPAAQPAAPAVLNFPANMRIAYINSQRLIEEAPGAREAQTTIQREMDKYRAELALLEDSIKNMQADYQQRSVMLSPDAKKKQEDAIRAKMSGFETRSQQYDANITKRQGELVQPIMDRINKVLGDIRKEHNISIILDVSSRSIVQADTTLDLTNEALRRLRAAAPAPPPKKQ